MSENAHETRSGQDGATPHGARPLIPLRQEDAPALDPVHYRVHHLTSYRYAKPVTSSRAPPRTSACSRTR